MAKHCGIWFEEARHENVKAMVEVTKEYGVIIWRGVPPRHPYSGLDG